MPAFDAGDLVAQLDSCPLCGESAADVRHVLSACPRTLDLYAEWAKRVNCPRDSTLRQDWRHLRMELFAGRTGHLETDVEVAEARVSFVGSAMRRVARATVQLEASN